MGRFKNFSTARFMLGALPIAGGIGAFYIFSLFIPDYHGNPDKVAIHGHFYGQGIEFLPCQKCRLP